MYSRVIWGIPASMDESRFIELELRYMQQSELLQQLSDVLYAQQQALDALRAEVDLLKRKLEGDPGMVDARQQERPPHY
jgi:SlyX protein